MDVIKNGINWSINAINQNNSDLKSPSWVFRLLTGCIFIIIYIYFLVCIFKFSPVVYSKFRNKNKENLEVDKIIQSVKSKDLSFAKEKICKALDFNNRYRFYLKLD